MTIAQEKQALRPVAAASRCALHRSTGAQAAENLLSVLLAAVDLPTGMRVAGFWPVRDEIDTRPLLAGLHARALECLLPVVVGQEQPLLFRRWRPEMVMVTGAFRIPEPPQDSPDLEPELLLVPLLAFDANGYRLGYGGGFYDRTLAGLRARAAQQGRTAPLAIGVGFSGQRLDKVPHDRLDEPLDGILTERSLMLPQSGKHTSAHPLLR